LDQLFWKLIYNFQTFKQQFQPQSNQIQVMYFNLPHIIDRVHI